MDELSTEDGVEQEMVDDLRHHFSDQDRRFTAQYHGTEDGADQEHRAIAYQRLKRELISAERHTIIELRNEGVINDEVMRKIQHDLDLEELRLQP